MTAQDYVVIGTPIQYTQWNASLQQSVQGYNVTVRDSVTGGIVTVFVPSVNFTADNVNAIVEAELERYRAVAQLGRTTPAS